MRKFAIPALVLAAASVAAPSFAQAQQARGYEPNHRAPSAQQQHGPQRPPVQPPHVQQRPQVQPQRPHAQPHRPAPQPAWYSVSDRKSGLERKIFQAQQSRMLSNRDAQRLRNDLNALVRKESQDRRNGLSMSERRELDRQFERLERRVPEPRNNRHRR